jgi:hypothetical protein
MKPHKEKTPQEFFETDGDLDPKVDDIYSSQKDYFKTPRGKKALRRARKNYDKKNPEKRRQQKRDYMRRKRDKNPDIWRD